MHARSAGSFGASCTIISAAQELSAPITAEQPMHASAIADSTAAASAGIRCAEDVECSSELQVSMSWWQYILAVPTMVPGMFLSSLLCGAKQEAELKQALTEYLQGLDSVNDALSQGPESAEAQQVY